MNRYMKFFNSRRGLFTFILAITLLFVSACARESTRDEPVTTTPESGSPSQPSTAPPSSEVAERDTALVRVIHAIPGTPADILADNKEVFSDLSYKTITPYKELADERHTFALRPTDQETAQPLAENSEGLAGGNHYTVVAMPTTDGKATLTILNDDLTPTTTNKAAVRVVNASPDAGEIDVYLKGQQDALFGGINFQSEVGYKEVDPTTATLEVRPEGQNRPMLTVPTKLESGKHYTVVIVGQSKGTSKLEAIVVEDHLRTSTTTERGETTTPGMTDEKKKEEQSR